MNASHDFPRMLVTVFQAVLTASWQGSLAILLVLLVRQALGGRAPARWHYLLWFLVLARLLVPAMAMPRNPASLENIPALAHPFQFVPAPRMKEAAAGDGAANFPPDFAPESLHPLPANPLPSATPNRIRTPWSSWTLAALTWIIGALVLANWFLASAARFQRRLRREVYPVDETVRALWESACQRWLRRAPPRILAADWIASPALMGLWRPTLLIPRQALSSFSPLDWENVFAHEIAHLRSRDHWSQLLLLLALCAHWFNPLVWLGIRRLRADRELAADEWALQRLESERALGYGETLLKTLAARPGNFFRPGMVGISEEGAQMKQRLRRITAFLPGRRLWGSLAGVSALLALGSVLLGQGAPAPAVSPVKRPEKKEDSAASLSLQPPRAAARNLPEEIQAAAREGDVGRVAFLLRTPATPGMAPGPDFGGARALDDLLHRRELPAFTLLLDEIRKTPIGGNWNVNDEDLSALVKEGRTDFLDVLLARRFDLDRLRRQAPSAAPAITEWLERRVAEAAKQRADIEALGKAASEGDLPAMRQLVDGGADVNGVGRDDNTPLIRAVTKDHLDAAQFLLDHGAQVEKPRFPGWDYTPLCLVHSVAMAELLKKAGANVHARLFHRDVNILTYVARWGASEVVAWFLQQGLDPRMIGDNNETLLFGLKDARTAELLLNAGVDPNHANEFGATAICNARSAEVAQKLIAHGAKVKDLPEPLLPRMALEASAGAMQAVLKAGADHDAVTLQQTLSRVIDLERADPPEKSKMKDLLIAYGAKLSPASIAASQTILCRGNISAEGGAFIDHHAIKALYYEHYKAPGPDQVSGSDGGSIQLYGNGGIPMRIRADADTATFAFAAKGYATTYAGPFTPPFKEKIDGIELMMMRGFSGTIQTVDEAGQPIAGVNLSGYYPGPPLTNLADAATDASGSATLDHIGAAALNIRAIAEGYQADEIESIHLDPKQPYRWMLKKAVPLPGQITSAATGQPIAGASIKLAGVRGSHPETYSYPEAAPLLATSDAQGRFTLTTLRPDSRYFFFVEAPGHGGVLLSEIKAGQTELKIALGPELIVRGKALHIPAGLIYRGQVAAGYNQFFKIGDEVFVTGHSVGMRSNNGEADFSIGPLYANPIEIRIGDKSVKLDAKDLQKSDLTIDLAPPAANDGDAQRSSEKPLRILPITIEDRPDEFSAKRFTLHIPIKAIPGVKIDLDEFVVQVLFFDTVNGRTGRNVVQTGADVNSHWVTPPANWVKSDTEELAVEYQLPVPRPDSHENREYFGYLVRLYYKKQLQAVSGAPEQLGKDHPAAATLPP